MSEQEHKVLKEQRDRRKRVQHIRTGIITVISVWMIGAEYEPLSVDVNLSNT